MSGDSKHPEDVNSNIPEDKKIFFQGLEKCLEAFTSGEGRVVRKYARLLSQLTGVSQDDEAISWSSSDETEPSASSLNTSLCRRTIQRKLNSQIDFGTRVCAKENGRRLTRAHFRRSWGRLSQHPISAPPSNTAVGDTRTKSDKSSASVPLKQATSAGSPEGSRKESSDAVTPVNDSDRSPVFKLSHRSNRKISRFRRKQRIRSEVPIQTEAGTIVETNLANSSALVKCSLPPVLSENICDESESFSTSPILQSPASTRRRRFSSRTSSALQLSSTSPIMRKTVRRKRRHSPNASPILGPQKKKRVFKKKRQTTKSAISQNSTQASSVKNTAGSPILAKWHLPSGNSLLHFNDSAAHEVSKSAVKRILDFTVENVENLDILERQKNYGKITSKEGALNKENDHIFKTPSINRVLKVSKKNIALAKKHSVEDLHELEEIRRTSLLNDSSVIENTFCEKVDVTNIKTSCSRKTVDEPNVEKATKKKCTEEHGITTEMNKHLLAEPLLDSINTSVTNKTEIPGINIQSPLKNIQKDSVVISPKISDIGNVSLNESAIIEASFKEPTAPLEKLGNVRKLSARRVRSLSLRKKSPKKSDKEEYSIPVASDENTRSQTKNAPGKSFSVENTESHIVDVINATGFINEESEPQNFSDLNLLMKKSAPPVIRNSHENRNNNWDEINATGFIDENSEAQNFSCLNLPTKKFAPSVICNSHENKNNDLDEINATGFIDENSEPQNFSDLDLPTKRPASSVACNIYENKNSNLDKINATGFIDENSEPQNFSCLNLPTTENAFPVITNIDDNGESNSNEINATCFIDENSERQNTPCVGQPIDEQQYRKLPENHPIPEKNISPSLINETIQPQDVSCLQTPVNTGKRSLLQTRTDSSKKQQDGDDENSKKTPKSIMKTSEKITEEIRAGLTLRSATGGKSYRSKNVSFSHNVADQNLLISQSSSPSDFREERHLNGCRTESPETDIVPSEASCGDRDNIGRSPGAFISSVSSRSPVISSPVIISSAGSSPNVRANGSPFIVIEDEYNAPPKRRSKKLDPTGIASRLQRLLNQRRSAICIWQYKRSKLRRLTENADVSASDVEGTNGTLLKVCSVWIEYSHVIFSTRQIGGVGDNENPLRGKIIVILDPGTVLKLGKIMTASSIQIYPPWQAMDLVDRNATVILGANLVEVVSMETVTETSDKSDERSVKVQKYSCHCLSESRQDAEVLDCWDGAQSIGLLDILFPRDTPTFSQLLQCDESVFQRLSASDMNNSACKPTKYCIKEMLSAHSTISHGKAHILLTVLRILCFWQRSGESMRSSNTFPHWSIIGEDDSKEVCEVFLGSIQSSEKTRRLKWSDFLSGRALGKTYRFRGVAISQRLERSRYCGEWEVLSDEQRILYILAPSMQFSFLKEDSTAERKSWEPEITSLGDLFERQSEIVKPKRVSVVCRVLHADENKLYLVDQSVAPRLHSVALQPSVYIPPSIFAAVRRPKPTKLTVLLQDLEISKEILSADKLSRVLVLNESGLAYPKECSRKDWPAAQEVLSALSRVQALPTTFSIQSTVHSLVMLSGSVCGVDESSALIWPACGTCGSPLDAEETVSQTPLQHCTQCSSVCKELIVHMSLIVCVSCPGFTEDSSVRVKLLHDTVQKLLRAMPKEGQDYMVREALGKPVGPIRCEIISALSGNYFLRELPTALWT